MFGGLFVSLVYCAESTVCWFVVREKHCWMAADSADKSKRTGSRRLLILLISQNCSLMFVSPRCGGRRHKGTGAVDAPELPAIHPQVEGRLVDPPQLRMHGRIIK
jgi:hypothetical protein